MTNTHFDSIEAINDVQTRNAYWEHTQQLGQSPGEMMEIINYISREHAHTPMQWNAGPNAGFTTGTPWIPLNPNYTSINAEFQVNDPDSVYHFYRRLLGVRRASQTLVYGHYQLLLPDSEQVYAYLRTLNGEQVLVMCNFTGQMVPCPLPEGWEVGQCLLSNYDSPGDGQKLRPFEAFAMRRGS